MTFLRRFACLPAALLGVGLSSDGPAPAESPPGNPPLEWLASGVQERLGGFRPHRLPLTNAIPRELKLPSTGDTWVHYGTLEVGPSEAPRTIHVVVEPAGSRPGRLFVDDNGDGDFAGVEGSPWTVRSYERPDGNVTITLYNQATIDLPVGPIVRKAQLKFYCFDSASASAGPLVLFYYADYGVAGEVRVGGRNVPFILSDSACRGEFSPRSNRTADLPLVWLDLDGNGEADRGEQTLAQRPFTADGGWWAVTNLTAEGRFEVVAAEKPPEPAKPPGPDLSPGRKAPRFSAGLVDGGAVDFPDDFKGKIVLLDFWATWCGPCVAELPNVVNAYEAYHGKGFEVLGISLDRSGAEEQLRNFTRKNRMPWGQVFDGRFWEAEVARLYGVRAIPHMLLVDGDTGVILANKDLRGARLAPAIAAALESKLR